VFCSFPELKLKLKHDREVKVKIKVKIKVSIFWIFQSRIWISSFSLDWQIDLHCSIQMENCRSLNGRVENGDDSLGQSFPNLWRFECIAEKPKDRERHSVGARWKGITNPQGEVIFEVEKRECTQDCLASALPRGWFTFR
jgi:hypothetical protein